MEAEVEIRRLLSKNKGKPYVYGLFRPSGEIFYVGKGTNRRLFVHGSASDRYNPHKINIIAKIRESGQDISRKIFKFFETDDEALDYELSLIREYGRVSDGGLLSNVQDVAHNPPLNLHGSSKEDKYLKMVATRRENGSYKHSPETLELISKMVRSAGATPKKVASWRAKIGKKLPPRTEESKLKVGVSNSKKPLALNTESGVLLFLNQRLLWEYLSTLVEGLTFSSMKNLSRQIKSGKLFMGFEIRYATTEEREEVYAELQALGNPTIQIQDSAA